MLFRSQGDQRAARVPGHGQSIRFININDKLMDDKNTLLPDVSTDGLHLEEKGYDAWAAALEPIFTELLGPPAQTDAAPPPTGDPSAAKGQ